MTTEGADSTQISRVPMLKPDEFDLWKYRIKQYMLITDYQMWDIVENGPKYKTDANGVRIPRAAPSTDAERRERGIELKALNTLLISIPNEYQQKFEKSEDAKVLMEGIEKRFGGNESTKKNKRSLLKQQFENFGNGRSETLTQIYDRFSRLVSELENHNVQIDKDDLNRKFLRSLGDEWTMYTVGLRQSKDLDEKEIDDLYNDLKSFGLEVEGKKQSICSSQNAAFLSKSGGQVDLSKGYESTSIIVGSSSSQDRSNDLILQSFFANHVDSTLTNEELEQVNSDDLEEMDIKW